LALANLTGTSHKCILNQENTFVIMPTGGGNQCYQLPALIQEGTHIVVSPLIAEKIKWMPFEVYLQKMGSLMY
jgi:hypothetical protein